MADSGSIVKAVQSNDSGDFRISGMDSGSYFVKISSIGYVTWKSPVFNWKGAPFSVALGEIELQAGEQLLSAVSVKAPASMIRQTGEGLVIDPTKSLLTTGSTILQVLERSSGISIDYQNNSITVNGKQGVQVMLDGRLLMLSPEQVLRLLSGMNAENLEKIEILSTPGVKYDAEGSAGIINIVSRKQRGRGTLANVSLTAGYGRGEKVLAGVQLTHHKGRFRLNGNYSYSLDHTYSDIDIQSGQLMPLLGGALAVTSVSAANRRQQQHDAGLGMEMDLDSRTKAGIQMNLNSSLGPMHTETIATYTVLPDSSLYFRGNIDSRNRWNNLLSTLYLEKQSVKKGKWRLGVDFLSFRNTNPNTVNSSFLNEAGEKAGGNDSLFSPWQRGYAETRINVAVGKLDYERPLSGTWKIESGLKASVTRVNSSAGIESLVDDVWIDRTGAATETGMREAILAAYANATVKPVTNLSISLGLRYEYSMMEPVGKSGNVQAAPVRRLGALFPAFFLNRQTGAGGEWQLSFTKRISRPSYNDLATYVVYSDPTAVFTGNPFLQPAILYNFRIGYSQKGYSLSMVLSDEKNAIIRYQLGYGPVEGLLYVAPRNLGGRKSIDLTLSLPIAITEWWKLQIGGSGGPRKFELTHTPLPAATTYFGFTANASIDLRFPKAYGMEISGWYSGSSYNGNVMNKGFGSLNAAIKKVLDKNRGTLQLTANDLLRSIRVYNYYGAVTPEVFSIKNEVIYKAESTRFPIIKLSYTRTFGSLVKKKAEQVPDRKEEESRVRKE
ncbi:putative TonB-dependent receptor [Flavihumibacter petaseus NBRC 106054]|uniref:Putative TonB-dependent receptor n=2 Tax=Flavihumibacter TaxID=1004301 RepID=A0A0E9N0J1_9BACT|nr:putative TonB-dependent receptor [Flavihumibacter petaseus NBRC 106054]